MPDRLTRDPIGTLMEEANGFQNEIVEIESVTGAELLLILRIGIRDEFRATARRLAGHVFGAESFCLEAADSAEGRADLTIGLRDLPFPEDVLHELFLIIRVIDHEVTVVSDACDIAAQDADANGMECAHDGEAPLTPTLSRGEREFSIPFPIGRGQGEGAVPRRGLLAGKQGWLQ